MAVYNGRWPTSLRIDFLSRTVWIALLFLLLPLVTARRVRAESNLIQNPGFEEGSKAWKFPLSTKGGGKITAILDEERVYSGKASARLEFDFKSNAQFYAPVQVVAVLPDTEYVLSAYIKTELESGTIHLQVQDRRGWKLLHVSSPEISGHQEWARMELLFRTTFTTEEIRIGLRHIGRPNDGQPMKGRVLLDDIVLAEKDSGHPRLSREKLEEAIRESGVRSLENNAVRITFSQPRLRVRSFESKRQPGLVLSPGLLPEAPLYSFTTEGPGGCREEIRSTDAQAVSLKQEGPHTYRLEAKHAGSLPIVAVRVTLDEAGWVDLRLEPVRPKEGWAVREIVFPQLVTRGQLEGTPEETFVGGDEPVSLDGGWHFRSGAYPVPSRLPLLYQYGKDGGAYLMLLDPDQWVKNVEMLPQFAGSGEIAAIIWRYRVQMAPGDRSPALTARLGLIEHSPYEAAEIYREWAETQPWFPQPLDRRWDIGGWRLRGVPHYFIYLPESGPNILPQHPAKMSFAQVQDFVKQLKQHRGRFRLTEVPAVMGALPREITELGGVVDLRGWEKWGLWMNPDRWPPRQGEETLRRAIAAIHQAGFQVTADVMFDVINITNSKENGGGGEAGLRAIKERGILPDEVAIKSEQGYIVSTRASPRRGAAVCPSSPVIFQDAVWTLAKMKEIGFDDVQFDGGGGKITLPCWNTKHPHPPGAGYWQTEVGRNYLDRIRAAIPGAREVGFGFVEEYGNELRAHSYVAV